ncbi:hypothetical protein O7599_35155 [Streptomyces sp. WMMC500]|uniref:hypothetical protein n=1 Tax=Streptomyces sp. WMMC500 TaxID=3015154 RepID=UPI00248BC3F6|nr:hypothetical protein [Streptomyces sp. WMMC500]WBB60681.1 hypothetical protein O7599_35155 [Streptomyces sp. WMMC500]
MRYAGYVIGGLSGAAAGGYFVLYLYRWEWQRALISGVLLLAVEVLLVGIVLHTRVSRLRREVAAGRDRTEEILRGLERTRTEPSPRFRWLEGRRTDGTDRTYVFVPVLMAAGAVMSAAAWAVQKVAAATGRPADRRTAARLAGLAAPPGGVARAEPLEARPAVRRPPRVRTLVVGVLALAALVLGLGLLADATRTRSQQRPPAAATTVVFEVAVRGSADAAAGRMAARDLWESCRRATRVPARHAPLSRLEGDVWVGSVRPALGDHDRMRLRGCLGDATAERTTAKVLGDGQIGG